MRILRALCLVRAVGSLGLPAALAPFRADCAAGVSAVVSACAAAARLQGELCGADAPSRSIAKDDASPVTVADFAAQAIVLSSLAERFPSDSFIAEERSAVLAAGGSALGERRLEDAYMDTAAADLARRDCWLRLRGGRWELKMPPGLQLGRGLDGGGASEDAARRYANAR